MIFTSGLSSNTNNTIKAVLCSYARRNCFFHALMHNNEITAPA